MSRISSLSFCPTSSPLLARGYFAHKGGQGFVAEESLTTSLSILYSMIKGVCMDLIKIMFCQFAILKTGLGHDFALLLSWFFDKVCTDFSYGFPL